MIFLDTHAVVWLYQKQLEKFTPEGLERLEKDVLYISPMVGLELEYLYEIERLTIGSEIILSYLQDTIGLETDVVSFLPVAERALKMKWTRDPFDRIISAQADFHSADLLTKDAIILEHYGAAIW